MVNVAVVDYGMGNLRSVEQALRTVAPEAEIVVTADARVIAQADRVVFPGQGAMPDCMRELEGRGLRAAVLDAARNKPFLGICIGLQMLFEHSAEGDVAGLGLLRGGVLRFAANLHDAQGRKLKVPHMGWNQVRHVGVSTPTLTLPLEGGGNDAVHPLWAGIAQDARFYFVHSYYVQPQDESLIQATSDYPQPFVCAVAQENLFAVQFHPEKSHAAGLKLLQNFVQWNP
ncbi:MAG: imidazole glycerol phosphate synthase subunit HisH [Gallionella sp.]|nr:imidazole glycerol phosphate synthase subunit HisH [Gallionella sp.]